MECRSTIDRYPVLRDLRLLDSAFTTAFLPISQALDNAGKLVYGEETVTGSGAAMYEVVKDVFFMRFDDRRLNYKDDTEPNLNKFEPWCNSVALAIMDAEMEHLFEAVPAAVRSGIAPSTTEEMRDFPAPNGVVNTAYVLGMQQRIFKDRTADPEALKKYAEFPWRWNILFDRLEMFFLGVIF